MAHIGSGGAWAFRGSDDPVLKARPTCPATIFEVHAEQKPRERLLLYSMVLALAPQRVLEIGVRFGGGARIIHAALRDLGRGVYVGVDPMPELDFEWATIADRCTLITGFSPAALPEARDAAGGEFDFVFLDGDHNEAPTRADLRGIVDVTAPGAAVLCHDAYHEGVERAIGGVIREGAPLLDCGIIATTLNDGVYVDTRDGQEKKRTRYGGVRMLRRT